MFGIKEDFFTLNYRHFILKRCRELQASLFSEMKEYTNKIPNKKKRKFDCL